MTIGYLGEILFEVSEKEIKTLRDVSWSGSVSIATHQRHLGNALQEFVGVDPDSIEFKMRVSKYLGSDPMKVIAALFDYQRKGTAVPLTLGKKAYGKYKWLVKKHKITFEHFDKVGNLVGADITVSLIEYTKE